MSIKSSSAGFFLLSYILAMFEGVKELVESIDINEIITFSQQTLDSFISPTIAFIGAIGTRFAFDWKTFN